jgi:hypothetical protein
MNNNGWEKYRRKKAGNSYIPQRVPCMYTPILKKELGFRPFKDIKGANIRTKKREKIKQSAESEV